MEDYAHDFDKTVQPAGQAPAYIDSTTYYAETPEEQAKYARRFDNGKMVNGAGRAVDTADGRGFTVGSEEGRHLYVMGPDGTFYTGDMMKEVTERYHEAQAQGESTQERFHHSSFLAGREVAGAGEIEVAGGQVSRFSDVSGHYKPGSQQMVNVAKELESQQAGVEKIGAEFIGKQSGEKKLRTSALEILGYEGYDEQNAERRIRESHAKKDGVMSELLAKTKPAETGEALAKPSDVRKMRGGPAASASGPAAPAANPIPYENDIGGLVPEQTIVVPGYSGIDAKPEAAVPSPAPSAPATGYLTPKAGTGGKPGPTPAPAAVPSSAPSAPATGYLTPKAGTGGKPGPTPAPAAVPSPAPSAPATGYLAPKAGVGGKPGPTPAPAAVPSPAPSAPATGYLTPKAGTGGKPGPTPAPAAVPSPAPSAPVTGAPPQTRARSGAFSGGTPPGAAWKRGVAPRTAPTDPRFLRNEE